MSKKKKKVSKVLAVSKIKAQKEELEQLLMIRKKVIIQQMLDIKKPEKSRTKDPAKWKLQESIINKIIGKNKYYDREKHAASRDAGELMHEKESKLKKIIKDLDKKIKIEVKHNGKDFSIFRKKGGSVGAMKTTKFSKLKAGYHEARSYGPEDIQRDKRTAKLKKLRLNVKRAGMSTTKIDKRISSNMSKSLGKKAFRAGTSRKALIAGGLALAGAAAYKAYKSGAKGRWVTINGRVIFIKG